MKIYMCKINTNFKSEGEFLVIATPFGLKGEEKWQVKINQRSRRRLVCT